MDFTDISKNLTNGENMGGIVTKTIIFGKWDDVATWPTAPVAPADVEENGVWVGDVVMSASKRAFTMYATEDTGELALNAVGEMDGVSFEAILNLFHPGMQKKILGFMGAVKNEDLFFIVEDSEGQYYLIGDSNRPAKFVPGEGGGTGKETSARKGFNMQFKYKCNLLRTYVGDVTSLLSVSSS